LLLLAFARGKAQHEFGITLNGGASKIIAERHLIYPTKYSFAPSGHAGFFYNYYLGKSSLVGLDLLFMQIESKERMSNIYADPSGLCIWCVRIYLSGLSHFILSAAGLLWHSFQ